MPQHDDHDTRIADEVSRTQNDSARSSPASTTTARTRGRSDPEAAALMRHAAHKYAALARKHGLDPWEAATAAFEAMRTAAVRRADDPWAVITRAVQITCIAENRANGLLCSVHQARRPRYSSFHDAERFSDRENPLTDYHPAFRADPFTDDEDDVDHATEDTGSTGVESAVEDTIALLCWHRVGARGRAGGGRVHLRPPGRVRLPCRRVRVAAARPSRPSPSSTCPAPSWYRLLRIILGSPDPHLAGTNAGRGVLLRLLIGDSLRHLIEDGELETAIKVAAPGMMRGRP